MRIKGITLLNPRERGINLTPYSLKTLGCNLFHDTFKTTLSYSYLIFFYVYLFILVMQCNTWTSSYIIITRLNLVVIMIIMVILSERHEHRKFMVILVSLLECETRTIQFHFQLSFQSSNFLITLSHDFREHTFMLTHKIQP